MTSFKLKSAFTLVELLSVIAIMAVLMGLSIIGIRALMAKSKAAQAASNLRQLVIAQHSYAQDNKGFYTPTWSAASPVSWQDWLRPYLYGVSTGGFRTDPKSIFNVPDSDQGAGVCSIAMNIFTDIGASQWKRRVNAVPSPSRIILLGECVPANNDLLQPLDASLGGSRPALRREEQTKALMAFCDGHVSPVAQSELGLATAGQQSPWKWW